ncbi:DUF5110 domain-containing protein [Clostridiales bacterium COT073_COT-073]|nr:DUF5110 domain-containing protein [Clostridiales bacterium COT073_COT-073]
MTLKHQAFNGKILELKRNDEIIKVEAISSTALHIYSEKAENFPSYAVEVQPEIIDLTESEDKQGRLYHTGQIGFCLREDGSFVLMDAGNQVICAQYTGARKHKDALSDDFFKLLASEGHATEAEAKKAEVEIAFALEENDCIYGLGDKTGFLNKRGYEYEMWNTDDPSPQMDNFKALYKSIPFMMVLKENMAYGLFFDNHYKSYFDLGKRQADCFAYEAEGGALDFYFFAGQDLKEVLKQYTDLTGKTPLPQLWTLGYHQSRWGYRLESEIREIAENMRKHDLPCDAIHLDIDYMEGYRVFTWNEKRYQDPEKTLKDLKEMGIKAITIIDPGVKVDAGYQVYDEGLAKGYFATDKNNLTYVNQVWPGDSVYPDFGRRQVRQWWGDQHQFLLNKGVAGVWNDMNEPASFQGPLPDDVVFYDGEKPSTHKAMHNVYGHNMSKATFEGLKKLSKERPFVITRACYAGSQKYTTVWTGDNHSIWAHLQMAIPQLCNLGLSGFGFAGTDVGGFGSDATPELLARWYQVGCFSPLFRNHSALGTRDQEPWQFDQRTLDIARKYMKLRYELLPYIYDNFYQGMQSGLPVMRPLVLNYPFDQEVREKNDQFMLGENILVAPVVEQGVSRKLVYLPEGEWICYWSHKKYGAGYHIVPAPLDICPIFIKSGSILPKYPVRLSVDKHKDDCLILEIYGDQAEYLHYQDNGCDYAYEKGEYNLYHFRYAEGKLITEMKQQGYKKYQDIKIEVKR